MTTLYGIRSCGSCQLAKRWLDDHEIEYEFIDVRAEGVDESILEHWQEKLGWEALLNKRSITWSKIPPFDREDLNASKARELILNYPTVMKRPLLDTGSNLLLGFDKYAYEELGLK
ncbi:MAG: Spx/MgsR family RNA polymerase-binding regulatory protein [Gammaproteobacteria bacterium]|nr:Spx/MgsR family RNA polymerase-binding regulatory protein [Gammaproteobacteria bacterium]NND35623.1 Spx/MgsR family RNA polymerase-binding regulatory protein [Gammaproteobacteria bacterium]